jgi:hypothetical protein
MVVEPIVVAAVAEPAPARSIAGAAGTGRSLTWLDAAIAPAAPIPYG